MLWIANPKAAKRAEPWPAAITEPQSEAVEA
jgi:hypothetical protein